MKTHRLSLTAKLTGINLLLATALLAVIAVAWRQLPTTSSVGDVLQLERAQRATQHADMLHDALHADVLAALLAAAQGPAALEKVAERTREDAQGLRTELARLELMTTLDEPIRRRVAASREVAARYVAAAEDLVQTARQEPRRALALQPAFDAAFEATEQALAAQTATIAGALEAASTHAEQAAEQARQWLVSAALVTIAGGWAGVALIARSIRRSLMQLRDVARAIADGDLERRSEDLSHDEVGQLAGAVNRMADTLHQMIERMRGDAERIDFSARLTQALDMADTEGQAHDVVARALALVAPDRPMELLLADSSEAHLERAAAHPTAGAPGCAVDSPFACVAVRRGHAVRFASSMALDACPRLQGRPGEAVSACCVPVTFMGRALGVLHGTGTLGEPLTESQLDRLVTLGAQVGGRIGMVRAFERTQRQAATDALTGLPNRRTAEAHLRRLAGAGTPFAFVMADLDRFKLLNDTHGHQRGDEALRAFADVARDGLRPDDLACRWGGEEFAFVLAAADADQALRWADRLREQLQQTLRRRSAPVFTASFGICVASHDPPLPIESLVAAADVALYRAKAQGRDRALVSTSGDTLPSPAEPPRRSEPSAALDTRQLVTPP